MNMTDEELQLPVAVVAAQMCPDQALPESLQFCVAVPSAFCELLILIFMLHSDTEQKQKIMEFLTRGT